MSSLCTKIYCVETNIMLKKIYENSVLYLKYLYVMLIFLWDVGKLFLVLT